MPTLSLKSFTPLSASSEFVALLIDPCEKKNHVINLVSIHQTEQSPMTKMLIMLFLLLFFFIWGYMCDSFQTLYDGNLHQALSVYTTLAFL